MRIFLLSRMGIAREMDGVGGCVARARCRTHRRTSTRASYAYAFFRHGSDSGSHRHRDEEKSDAKSDTLCSISCTRNITDSFSPKSLSIPYPISFFMISCYTDNTERRRI